MRKPIPILPAKGEFQFGNCVACALSQAFSIPYPALKIIFQSLKLDIGDGCNFWECTKVVNLLAKNFDWGIKYAPNTTKVTLGQLIDVINDRKLLVMFDIHLAYVEKGILFDSYYYESAVNAPDTKAWAESVMMRQLRRIPTGWWVIDPLTANKQTQGNISGDVEYVEITRKR